jgi:MerR family transcriptional regulator, light-induced transcriptional regulator
VSEAGFGIGEVSERTGIAVPVLRMWEQRFGFPRPERRAGGRRRYSDREIELLRQVVRDRDGGLSLKAAIDRARGAATEVSASLFSGLRRTHADLAPFLLRKRTLMNLSHAIEDEYMARSEPAVLFASFQRERFYRGSSERRWRDLARGAELAIVFADFDRVRRPAKGPVEVPLDPDDPLAREWSLICEATTYGACMAGWERPGQEDAPDFERRFETIWSVEPDAVRDATSVAMELVEQAVPDLIDDLPARLRGAPAPGAADVRTLIALTNRMIGYSEAGER